MNRKTDLELAIVFLQALKESGIYDDYIEDEGIDDDRWMRMIAGLEAINKPLTHALIVNGESRAASVAQTIVAKSQWFEFTPLPDDQYEFVVKQENRDLLERLVSK